MKKLLLLILICFTCSGLHTQTLRVRVDSLSASIARSNAKIENINESIDELSKQVDNLSYIVEAQKDIISQEQSAIENSLSGTSLRLDIFSIVIAVAGIGLGIYISRKETNMQELLNQVKLLEEKTSKTKDEIVELNDNILNNTEGLYARLRREETVTLLKRLVYEPNDVVNLSQMLLSRDLEEKNFKYLLAAYRNLENRDTDSGLFIQGGIRQLSPKGYYLVLFFQHFCGQAINHDLVRDDLIKFFPSTIRAAFKNDIVKSTQSLVMCLNKTEEQYDKVDILSKYLVALNQSKFRDYMEPYSIIVSKYKNGTELQTVWLNVKDKVVSQDLKILLSERFKDDEEFLKALA